MSNTTAIVSATIKARAEDGTPGTIEAKIEHIGGNRSAHFSLTAWFCGKNKDGYKNEFGGCCHDEILAVRPDLKPIADLHLADYPSGAPMYAVENGYYWLAGAVGGLGERYHGANGSPARTAEQCLDIVGRHFRISKEEAEELAECVRKAYDEELGASASKTPEKDAKEAAMAILSSFVGVRGIRWEEEAKAGRELIESLNK